MHDSGDPLESGEVVGEGKASSKVQGSESAAVVPVTKSIRFMSSGWELRPALDWINSMRLVINGIC